MLAARRYAATKNVQRAEELLRRVIETDPTYLRAYGALAQLYVAQNRLEEALAEFEELARRDSKPVGALTFAGFLLERQGKLNAARTRFERALQVDPRAAVAANNLA
jgi:Tfp pilus assembly protein PilF